MNFTLQTKKINPKKNKTYYWFKGGLIHQAQGGIAGDVLDDKFIKMYHNNQLAEQGEYKNGLRIGLWKTWHQNGKLATTINYSNGLRCGKFSRYDQTGNLVESGKFSSDLKTGNWTNSESTEIVTYRKGIIVKQKETFTKSEKYRIKQENINLENAQQAQKELEAIADAVQLTNYKAKVKEDKALAKAKAKKERDTKKATQKAEKQAKKETKKQSENGPKEALKVKTFFKNLFKKKDKSPK
jgi:hypothetical protein